MLPNNSEKSACTLNSTSQNNLEISDMKKRAEKPNGHTKTSKAIPAFHNCSTKLQNNLIYDVTNGNYIQKLIVHFTLLRHKCMDL